MSAPAASTSAAALGQKLARLLPAPARLKLLDLSEVDGDEHALGRVKATQSLSDQLVDELVVLGAALPTHPAEQADGQHVGP